MPRRIASAMKNPTDILVDLRELEQDEVLAIELFALDNWTHQCGLVGPEEPEEDTSEEEQMRVDEEMERHEEILRRGRPAEEYYA
jgi:hypothetical protein